MWLHSIEFYVISAVVAAAVIAFMARPPRRGPARTRLIAPDLRAETAPDGPQLIIDCDEAANLTVTRTGITNVTDVKISVTIQDHDIIIEESAVTAAPNAQVPELTASFGIEGVGRDRYHLSYTAAHQSLFTATPFTIRPGLHFQRNLNQ